MLLTKSSGGGGHGGGGGGGSYGAPSDSYGAPPPSSYGPPSGGGGGYGGGGWGRSFHKWPIMNDKQTTKTEIADGFNRIPMTGEVLSNAESIDYLDYQDYQEPSPIMNSSSVISNWNTPSYTAFHQYKDTNVSTGLTKNNLQLEATVNPKGRSLIFDENPINPVDIINVIEKIVDSTTTTDQPVADVTPEFTTNAAYMDEWQATAEKTKTNNILSTNSNANIKLQQTELRRSKDIPLLREI